MSRLRKRRVALIAGIIVLLALLALAAGLLRGGSRAQTTTDSATESEQKALPTEPTNPKAGAPVESGGEPFRTCVVCHPDYERMPPATGDLILSTPKHLQANVACAT
jgi:hypothetical protein